MSFLRRLSTEEQLAKQLKQERLKQDLQQQCNERLQEKERRHAIMMAEDQREFELELHARGLQPPTKGGRGRVVHPSQQHNTSPLRENKNKNNSTIFTPAVPARQSFGRPKPFLATLNDLHGGPSANQEIQKQRAREQLKFQLAEQVREKEAKKTMREYEEKVHEAREMQMLLDKGLDFWGMPLRDGATPLKLPERLRPYLDPANAPSPSAPAAISLYQPPSMLARTLHEEAEYTEPTDEIEEYSENQHQYEHQNNNNNNDNNNNNTAQLQELTALCKQLVVEQKLLRETVDNQAEQLAARMSPARRRSPTRQPRRRRPRSKNQPNEKGSSSGRGTMMKKSRSSGGAAFGSSTTRMIAAEGKSYQKERRRQRRSGGRDQDDHEKSSKSTARRIRSMKPTKKEKEEARLRRIATRAEYAKKTRFVPRGVTNSQSIDPLGEPFRSNQSTQQHSRQQHQQQPTQQPPHPTWEDERPIRPSRGVPKLDGDSQFVTGYDRKRNPLASLASGNTPRRETLNQNDALDHEVTFVAKKFVKPQEHFKFDEKQ
jgi:hypothetical protein